MRARGSPRSKAGLCAYRPVKTPLFSFVSSLRFSDEAYRAAGKLNKAAWTIILGLGLVAQIVLAGSPLNLINLAMTVAALVYLADVKPALSSLTRR